MKDKDYLRAVVNVSLPIEIVIYRTIYASSTVDGRATRTDERYGYSVRRDCVEIESKFGYLNQAEALAAGKRWARKWAASKRGRARGLP